MTDQGFPSWMAEVAAAVPRIKVHQLTSFRPPADGSPRAASVLILFGEGPRGAEVLLLERAAEMRAHAGQVAFPGGRQDEADADAVAAALREAEEETGLDPSGVDVVGVLPALWLPVTDFLVTPVIGWWHTPMTVRAVDPAETASVHVIAIADLLDPANRGRVRHPSGYVGPAFTVGRVLVWGFTATVLARLFGLLGWERPWDDERYIELPDAVVAGAARDLASPGRASPHGGTS
jgi:8-oxo-dGTP pyrophosphatase MutT (NUDIX family)